MDIERTPLAQQHFDATVNPIAEFAAEVERVANDTLDKRRKTLAQQMDEAVEYGSGWWVE